MKDPIGAEPFSDLDYFECSCGPNRSQDIFELGETLQPSFERFTVKALIGQLQLGCDLIFLLLII
jgi:hypothetical protein